MKWLFKVLEVDIKSSEEALNKFGSEGWDVASFQEIDRMNMLRVVLKKPDTTLTLIG